MSAAAGPAAGAGSGTAQPGATSGVELPGIAFNVAGLLCYILWPVAPVFFLLVGPYNRNRFVRFHAFQAAFLWLGGIVVAIALQIVTSILGLIPVLGWIAGGLIWIAFAITFFVMVIVMMYKAYNGEWYSAPVIGNLARQQAEKSK
ncbi:MAG TPA: hypothetical protein VNM47_12660 [Terriglobia bacterium]|nr:hypothetical protein [Terriglobia bacterium]